METPATPIYLTLEKRKAYSALIVETLCAILIYFVTLFLGIPDLTKNGMSFRPNPRFLPLRHHFFSGSADFARLPFLH
jgi:hypothetical protein